MSSSSIEQYHRALKTGDTTVEITVAGFLARIAAQHHLNAFLAVYSDYALKRAKELDADHCRWQIRQIDRCGYWH
jgi:Asp-tRNA(Asn)/Glu-tRNA(Gln) amidotransferase A subunit family amidase